MSAVPLLEEPIEAPATAPGVSRGRRIGEIVLLWLFASMAAGLWHVNKMTIKRYYLHRFTWTSRDIVWMSPLGNLLLLAVPMAILVIVALVAPRFVPRWLATFVPVFFAAMAMVLIVPGLENYAMWILSLGIAVQAARMVGTNGDRWLPRIRVATIAMGVLLVVSAAAMRIWRNTAEWRWARSAPAASADAPNVLILLLDTVRAHNLGLYGYARATSPSIDSLAAQSTVFDQAFAVAGWTLPSHCSFFTGRYPANHSCRWETALDNTPRTTAEVFRDQGYRTAGFAANLFYATDETGLSRGFTRWEDFKPTFKQIICSSTLTQTAILRNLFFNPDDRWTALRRFNLRGDPKPEVDRVDAEDVGTEFMDWVGRDQRPFFAYLNFFDAHEPYMPPAEWGRHFVSEKPRDLDRYDGGIAYMDREVGRILANLKERGILDQTIVVIMGDHGEQFGEHEIWTHGNSLYIQLLRVPLIVRYPAGVPSGARVGRAVTLRDLPRTLLDLARIKDTKGIFGTSLVPAIADSAHETSPIVAETEQTPKWTKVPTFKGPVSAVLDQKYHYIHASTGTEWLYDFRNDPDERTDLVKDPQFAAVLSTLRAEMKAKGRSPKVARGTEP